MMTSLYPCVLKSCSKLSYLTGYGLLETYQDATFVTLPYNVLMISLLCPPFYSLACSKMNNHSGRWWQILRAAHWPTQSWMSLKLTASKSQSISPRNCIGSTGTSLDLHPCRVQEWLQPEQSWMLLADDIWKYQEFTKPHQTTNLAIKMQWFGNMFYIYM